MGKRASIRCLLVEIGNEESLHSLRLGHYAFIMKKISTTTRDGGRSNAEVRSVPSPELDALLTTMAWRGVAHRHRSWFTSLPPFSPNCPMTSSQFSARDCCSSAQEDSICIRTCQGEQCTGWGNFRKNEVSKRRGELSNSEVSLHG